MNGAGCPWPLVSTEHGLGRRASAQPALYHNLGEDKDLALAVDAAIRGSIMDGWRDSSNFSSMKLKRVRKAIRGVLEQARASAGAPRSKVAEDNDGAYPLEAETTRILDLAMHQND